MIRRLAALLPMVLTAGLAAARPAAPPAAAGSAPGGLGAVAITSAADARRALPVSIPGLGRVTLELRDNPLLAPGARTTVTDAAGVIVDAFAPPVRTLAGTVAGDPSSVVRLTVSSAGVGGFVQTRGVRTWIEPDARDPRRTVAYPDSAGAIEFGDDEVEPPAGAAASHAGQVNALGIGSCTVQTCGMLTAHVILDGDVYYRNLGGDCFARQLTVLNAVDGIYAATATRIRLSVTQQNCRTAPDLGTTSTEALSLLNNLTSDWASKGSSRSLVYLFVGYDMPPTGGADYVGIAWRPGVCARIDPDPSLVAQRCAYGYSLGQMVGSMGTLDRQTKVTAHEIGHNFAAEHDDTGCNGSGRLMCSSIQSTGPLTFSAFSANQIRSHAEDTIGYLVSL